MSSPPSWLPPMVPVGGAWDEAVARLYDIFRADFVQGQPTLEGRAVWWDRRVLPGDRYEEGFWHLITRDDPKTKQRLPDFRRAERLPWCAPVIRNSCDPALRVWDFRKGTGEVRTYLWLEALDYVVILQKRRHAAREVAFLVTAYHIDGESQRQWMRRSYEQRCP